MPRRGVDTAKVERILSRATSIGTGKGRAAGLKGKQAADLMAKKQARQVATKTKAAAFLAQSAGYTKRLKNGSYVAPKGNLSRDQAVRNLVTSYNYGMGAGRRSASATTPRKPPAKAGGAKGGRSAAAVARGERIVSRFHAIGQDRKSTRLNSSHVSESRMPSSA